MPLLPTKSSIASCTTIFKRATQATIVKRAVVVRRAVVARRAIIGVYDVFCFILMAALAAFLTPHFAYAYVDPSVMTYTIQALAGVAVAVGAVAGVAFRRTRKKLFKLLNIDENARKEVEGDVHPTSRRGCKAVERALGTGVFGSGTRGSGALGSSAHAAGAQTQAARVGAHSAGAQARDDHGAHSAGNHAYGAHAQAEPSPKRGLDSTSTSTSTNPSSWSYKGRFVRALLVTLFFVFTIVIAAPFEIVAGGAEDLHFGIPEIALPLAILAIALILIVSALVSLLRGRAYAIALLAIFGVAVCCYVQALFMNKGLPLADGTAIDWSLYIGPSIWTGVVWVVLLALVFGLGHRFQKQTLAAALVLSVALVIVQGVGVASVCVDAAPKKGADEETMLTEEGMCTLSSKNNVIVFILDTFDGRLFNGVRHDYDGVLDGFDGFTLYDNATGSMIPTGYAVPYLMTGVYPQAGQTYQEYCQYRYDTSHFLQDINQAGYSVGLYTEETRFTADMKKSGIVLNLTARQFFVDWPGLYTSMAKCALYRDMPWVLKRFFWYYTDELNITVSASGTGNPSKTEYITNDAATYIDMKDMGMNLDDTSQNGAFRFIHLLGPHYPFTLSADGTDSGTTTSSSEQAVGCLEIVKWYLNQMKELGIYDSSTIIITADHGEWYLTDKPIEREVYPIYWVKQANADFTGTQFSSVPTGHCDYHATVIDAVGGNASAYGTPTRLVTAAPRDRFYYQSISNGKRNVKWLEWLINGPVSDFSNWSLTGRSWDLTKE